MTRHRVTVAAALAAAALLVLLIIVWVTSCGGQSAEDAARERCAAARDACVEVGVGRPIYIGTLLLETDALGQDAKRAVAIAVDYLDGEFDGVEGGVLGHPVSVISEAEDCTPKGGIVGAERLALEPSLLAVIGTTCSSAAQGAAAAVLSQKGILMVSPSNTSPLLTTPENHQRYYFRTAPNDLIQGAVVAQFARNRLAARTAGIISIDDAYSRELGKAFSKAFWGAGGKVVATAQIASLDAPIGAAVRAMAAARPGVIFLPLFEPACTRAVKAIRSTPALAASRIVVSESCQSPVLLRQLGPGADGVYASGPDDADLLRQPFYRDFFLPAYRREYGANPVGVFHATSWDAVNLLAGAVRRVAVRLPGGALLINREELRRAMLDVQSYPGMSGRLSCTPTGDCAQEARIAVYRAPAWPQVRSNAKPVFSEALALADVTGQG